MYFVPLGDNLVNHSRWLAVFSIRLQPYHRRFMEFKSEIDRFITIQVHSDTGNAD